MYILMKAEVLPICRNIGFFGWNIALICDFIFYVVCNSLVNKNEQNYELQSSPPPQQKNETKGPIYLKLMTLSVGKGCGNILSLSN